MITFFSTAKPFVGHNGITQRNALASWKRVHPDAEVILFGDDEGAEEVCRELGLRHEPCREEGAERVRRADFMFQRAQEIGRNQLFCYANCDIVLMSDFRRALEAVSAAEAKFLMVGRRWDTEIGEAIDFGDARWEEQVRKRATAARGQRDGGWIDYFAFSRGVYGADFPALVVGRVYWDNWMVWKALEDGCAVVDASRSVMAVHQNHDYSHHPQGKQGVWGDDEAKRNLERIGGWKHLRAIEDAALVLRADGLRKNTGRHWCHFKRQVGGMRRWLVCYCWHPVWFFLLDVSRPMRTALGLRGKSAGPSK
ncbi:MAG: hypothetical protein WA853_15450 [Candidatus Acidiferrum sp.]